MNENLEQITQRMETLEQLTQRLDMEEKSIANQLAVIAYIKMNRIEHYLAGVLTGEEYMQVHALMYDARIEIRRDVHIDALTAAWDFLIYKSDWKDEE